MALDCHSTTKSRAGWERELGLNFTDVLWDKAVLSIRSATPCARLELIQFKVLHRAHLSKSRLSEIYPNVTDLCDRCQGSPCNLSHMFFSCPGLQKFWSDYSMIMSEVLGKNIVIGPYIAIFGLSVDSSHINSLQSDVLAFTSHIPHLVPSGKIRVKK